MSSNKYTSHHRFKNLLEQTPTLEHLLKKANEIRRLNQTLKTDLDPALAQHCKVANLNQGRLILATSSPAWNHQLRFSKGDLLSSLRKRPEWCGLVAIESFIQPLDASTYAIGETTNDGGATSNNRADCIASNNNANSASSNTASTISAANGERLANAAKYITHTPLATALQRLAKHAAKL